MIYANKLLKNKWTLWVSFLVCISLIVGGVIVVSNRNVKAKELEMETRLAEMNSLLTNANAELKETQDELAVKEQALNNNITYIENVETALENKEAELQEAQTEISKKDDEIKQLNKDVANLKKQLSSQKNSSSAKTNSTAKTKESDVEMIAKTVYGEARGLNDFERSMVIWCILNRVASSGQSIRQVITAKNQFVGYKSSHPVKQDMLNLARDVLSRWEREKAGETNVGRTLPKGYLWFRAKDGHNVFRNKFDGNYTIWDMNCANPYA